MDKVYKTQAIVLSRRDWQENDCLFDFYTQEFGRIKAVAVSARKIQSKLMGHLSGVGLVEILFVRGRTQNKLTQAYLHKPWPLRSVADWYYASGILEIIAKGAPEGVKSSRVWQLMNWALDKGLSSVSEQAQKFILNIFILKLMKLWGYQVRTDTQKNALPMALKQLGAEHQALVTRIQDMAAGESLTISPKENSWLLSFLKKYLTYFLERPLESLKVI